MINGFINFDAVKSTETNGRMVSEYLGNHLINCYGGRIRIQKFLDYVKEKHCFVSLDLQESIAKTKTETHTLPDGTKFDIGSEAFLCAERMFHRSDANSLQKMVVDSLAHFSYYGKSNQVKRTFSRIFTWLEETLNLPISRKDSKWRSRL